MWLIAADPRRYAPVLFVLCLAAVVGGMCRVHTALVYGLPDAWLARFVVVGAVVLEFGVPLLIAFCWKTGTERLVQQRKLNKEYTG